MSATSVAIISYTTHSRHFNYGAVLHGYAFQRYLAERGCDVTVVDYIPKELERYHWKWPVLNAGRLWWNPVLMLRYFIRWSYSARANLRKFRKFRAFFNNRMKLTDKPLTERDLVDENALLDRGFGMFVCESDVIWKQREGQPLDRGFFLAFPAADQARKVAYAPSLGDKPMDEETARTFVRFVRDFAAISCRERQGASVVGNLLGHDIPWVLDPTLLLPARAYAEIAIPPRESGYVLLYTCMRFNRNMVLETRKYARRLGKKIIEVGNYGINRLVFGHRTVDDAGIEEWLGLFANADAVVCNSFHGICFSVIFGKPFYAFGRGRGDPRFSNICDALGLSNRLLDRDGRIPAADREIDFADVNARLATLRSRSEKFIRENIIDFCRGKIGEQA